MRGMVAGAVIWTAMAMTVLDTTIANLALPAIAHDFAVAPGVVVAVVQGYQLTIIATTLALAALGERFGYARVYGAGLALFTLASAGCALAPGLDALVAARLAQGLGAAAIMSVNGALVRHVFPPDRLGWAFGVNAMVIAGGALAGPPLGGLVMALGGWRWLFAINLLPGLLALLIGMRVLPPARGASDRFDGAAALLSVGAGAALGLGQGVIGGLLLILLVRRETGKRAPLLPIDLITMRPLRHAYVLSVLNFAAQGVVLVAMPFWLRDAMGLPPLRIGLVMAALPLGLGAAARVAGGRSDRGHDDGPWGLVLAAAGLGLVAVAAWAVVPWAVVAGALTAGAGFGLFQAPNNRAMIALAPRPRSGAAAGMLALARLCGQALGAACAALLLHHAGTASVAFAGLGAGFALAGAVYGWSMRGSSAASIPG